MAASDFDAGAGTESDSAVGFNTSTTAAVSPADSIEFEWLLRLAEPDLRNAVAV